MRYNPQVRPHHALPENEPKEVPTCEETYARKMRELDAPKPEKQSGYVRRKVPIREVLLNRLKEGGPARASEFPGVFHTSASKVLKQLMKEGLVTRKRETPDHRSHYIYSLKD